jgi:hypothetical protein
MAETVALIVSGAFMGAALKSSHVFRGIVGCYFLLWAIYLRADRP